MSETLYHYGVKGMKWGVRRYMNKDGSLTDAGKRHYDQMSGTKIHNKLQKEFNRAKGGAFGKNYGSNVTRVIKEQEERENNIKKRLRSGNKEYAALNDELNTIRKKYDDADHNYTKALDKGDLRQADKWSIECNKIDQQAGQVHKKMQTIEQRELRKVGIDEVSKYADRSVAALMDLGFDKNTAKSLTDKMLKDDKFGRAIYM